MMKKKTVRLISCIIAGILVAAMVFSMIASGLVYAGAVSSKELKSKLSDLGIRRHRSRRSWIVWQARWMRLQRPVPPCRKRSSSPKKKLRR